MNKYIFQNNGNIILSNMMATTKAASNKSEVSHVSGDPFYPTDLSQIQHKIIVSTRET
jgi:hypothetical protein